MSITIEYILAVTGKKSIIVYDKNPRHLAVSLSRPK